MDNQLSDALTRKASTYWHLLKDFVLVNGRKLAETNVGIRDRKSAREDCEEAAESQRQNFEAFKKLLPGLLEKHSSGYALIVDQKLKGSGEDLQALIDRAYSEFPEKAALIQPIQEELPRHYVGGAFSSRPLS